MEVPISVGDMSTEKEKSQVHGAAEREGERRDWSELPGDVLALIQSNLHLIKDFNRFRNVCNSWKFAAYPERHVGFGSQFLIEKRWDQSMVRLFHPFAGEECYCMDISDLRDSSIRSSGDGWLLVSKGGIRTDEIFLFNPSPRNPTRVRLPNQTILPGDDQIFILPRADRFNFSSNPDSDDCMIFGISKFENYVYFFSISPGENLWKSVGHSVGNNLVPSYSNPIYINGKFWCLFSRGELGIFDPNIFNNYEIFRQRPPKIGRRCSNESYLLNFDGDVMSVFVGNLGYPVSIFKWDASNSSWEEVEDLGEYTLFLSESSSFARKCEKEYMKNKIYFPRFYRGYGIYYCMKDGFYRTVGNHSYLSSQGFNETALQLDCCWIEATEAWLPPPSNSNDEDGQKNS